MICDKCGFEHNSRSVCPKCGARVVYVNEDYLRRKKEWEEAQKSGGDGNALPPGIMHSTREEYDRRHGRDRITAESGQYGHNDKKGGPETAGLSLDVIRERLQKAAGALSAFFRRNGFLKKLGRKRGRDNPVIRELKFEDEPDNPEVVAASAERKPERNIRRIVIIAAAAVIAAVAAVVIVNAVRNADRSTVFYYDGKYGYYDGSDEPLFGNVSGETVFAETGENTFLAYDEGALYICRDGENVQVSAQNPVPVAYNDSLSLVIFTSDGKTMVTDGENTGELDIDIGQGYTHACKVSGNGKYYILTVCSASDDFSPGVYTMYFGDKDGSPEQIASDYNDKEIIKAGDDGSVIYLDMATADYGIINGRNLVEYREGSTTVIAEGISQYRLAGDYIYYITSDGRLYMADTDNVGEPVFIDDETVEFADNLTSVDGGGVIYRKDGGYYAAAYDGGIQALFAADDAVSGIYFTGGNFLYYTYMNAIYSVEKTGAAAEGNRLFELDDTGTVVFYAEESCLAAIASDGTLHILRKGSEDKVVADNAESLVSVDNYEGIMYTSGGELYVLGDEDKSPDSLCGITGGIIRAVYSRKYFYFINDQNILYKISVNGKNNENLGYASYLSVISGMQKHG